MDCRGPYLVLVLYVGPPIQEELDHIGVTPSSSPHKRGSSNLKRKKIVNNECDHIVARAHDIAHDMWPAHDIARARTGHSAVYTALLIKITNYSALNTIIIQKRLKDHTLNFDNKTLIYFNVNHPNP